MCVSSKRRTNWIENNVAYSYREEIDHYRKDEVSLTKEAGNFESLL